MKETNKGCYYVSQNSVAEYTQALKKLHLDLSLKTHLLFRLTSCAEEGKEAATAVYPQTLNLSYEP